MPIAPDPYINAGLRIKDAPTASGMHVGAGSELVRTKTVNIRAGQSLSEIVDCERARLVGIQIPSFGLLQ